VALPAQSTAGRTSMHSFDNKMSEAAGQPVRARLTGHRLKADCLPAKDPASRAKVPEVTRGNLLSGL
jgi:hypothetical protein